MVKDRSHNLGRDYKLNVLGMNQAHANTTGGVITAFITHSVPH
jgi:hypothetical protein